MSANPSDRGEPSVDDIVRQLETLLGQEAVADDYVRLRIGILQAQSHTLSLLVHSPLGAAMPAELLRRRPLDLQHLRFDAGLLSRLYDSLEGVCGQFHHIGEDWSWWRSLMNRQPGLLEDLARQAANAQETESLAGLAQRLEMPAPLAALIGRLLAAPFVTHAVGQLGQATAFPLSSDGFCPACHSTPGLAVLQAEGGRRRLHCSLCGHAWMFARLRCPFCANEDQSALLQLAIDGLDARWIEACQQCRHYLKTVDTRRLPEPTDPIPLVEEVASLSLDLIAAREGYRAGLPYAALW